MNGQRKTVRQLSGLTSLEEGKGGWGPGLGSVAGFYISPRGRTESCSRIGVNKSPLVRADAASIVDLICLVTGEWRRDATRGTANELKMKRSCGVGCNLGCYLGQWLHHIMGDAIFSNARPTDLSPSSWTDRWT